MKYDDASWHSDAGDFPEDLPDEAGGTHIGMFLAWCLLNGHAGEELEEDFEEELDLLKQRQMTPGTFIMICDGKFVDDMISEEIQPFVESYFNSEHPDYAEDYATALVAGLPSSYHVPDTWESYDRISPLINKAYAAWTA